jgi:hypothetical protein
MANRSGECIGPRHWGIKRLAGAKQNIRESSTKLWKGVDPCHDSFGASRLRPIIVAGRPAASLCGGHPRRRPTTALALASGDALQHNDGLFDGVTLLAEIGEHFLNERFRGQPYAIFICCAPMVP